MRTRSLVPSTCTYTILTPLCYRGHLPSFFSLAPSMCYLSLKLIYQKNWAWKWRKIFKFCYLPMIWKDQFCQFRKWSWQGSGRHWASTTCPTGIVKIACILFFGLCLNDHCMCNFDHSFLPHLKYKCWIFFFHQPHMPNFHLLEEC